MQTYHNTHKTPYKASQQPKLSDRIYKCECGNIINRDFQASLNLKKYGENVLKQQFVA